MYTAPPVTPEALYYQNARRSKRDEEEREADEEEREAREHLERYYAAYPDKDPRRKTTGVVHMQADSTKYTPGTPIHYVGGGLRRGNQFRTTKNADEVTCKNCIKMLNGL